MSIPVSNIVNVTVSLSALFPARMGFGTLLIVTPETGVIPISERIRSYSDLQGVTNDWPADSEVVKSASAYYSQSPRPVALKVAIRSVSNTAAYLRGGSRSVSSGPLPVAQLVSTFTAIAAGSMNVTIGGVTETLTGLDFTGVASVVDIGTVIYAALGDATDPVIAASEFNGRVFGDQYYFELTSSETGSSATISFPTNAPTGTPIVDLLYIGQNNANKSNGTGLETIPAALSAIEQFDPDWYGFSFTKEMRDSFTLTSNGCTGAAEFAESRTKVFFNTTNDLGTLDPSNDTCISAVLKSGNFKRTITTFGTDTNQYPAQSVAGRAFTVNYSQPNSVITLMFKDLPTITVENLNTTEVNSLLSKNCNTYTTIGKTPAFLEGKMANGLFFDVVQGTDWLQDAIQSNIFGTLKTSPTRIAYTDTGISQLEQQLINSFKEGVVNGLIAPGTDSRGVYLPLGYTTSVVSEGNVNPSDKSARIYSGLSGVCLGAGAIQGVQVNVVFEQ